LRFHLRQAFHVDRRTIPLFLARHRFQHIDRGIEIALDGRLGRAEV
jgi:hypothetical protein